MSETHIAHLMKAASMLPQTNNTYSILESFYMMKCKEMTKGFHLPQKYFSNKVRCSHCCVLWRANTEIKVRPSKLSARQRRRLKNKKIKSNKNGQLNSSILHTNNLVQICNFCKQSTITSVVKPNKTKFDRVSSSNKNESTEPSIKEKKKVPQDVTLQKPAITLNLYKNTKDVFSLQDKSNTIQNTIKTTKVIKNNKKKKDKFAGLCQKAVLATAKLKEEVNKQKKLNLFLKPSY